MSLEKWCERLAEILKDSNTDAWRRLVKRLLEPFDRRPRVHEGHDGVEASSEVLPDVLFGVAVGHLDLDGDLLSADGHQQVHSRTPGLVFDRNGRSSLFEPACDLSDPPLVRHTASAETRRRLNAMV